MTPLSGSTLTRTNQFSDSLNVAAQTHSVPKSPSDDKRTFRIRGFPFAIEPVSDEDGGAARGMYGRALPVRPPHDDYAPPTRLYGHNLAIAYGTSSYYHQYALAEIICSVCHSPRRHPELSQPEMANSEYHNLTFTELHLGNLDRTDKGNHLAGLAQASRVRRC